MNFFRRLHIYIFVISLLAGCGIMNPKERMKQAVDIASINEWGKTAVTSEKFDFTCFVPKKNIETKTLSIYIEGDGLAWISRTQVSYDPTPAEPTALKLAMSQPGGFPLYMARPCQFDQKRNCEKKYWTTHRFAPEIIESYMTAIDKIKAIYNADNIELAGYSGGGAIAALIASKRSDIKRLITVAGTLDHKFWTEKHKVSSLSGSLNPADFAEQLKNINQIHFVGELDKNMPADIAKNFLSKFPNDKNQKLIVINGVSHVKGWDENWSKIYPAE